ncbi:TonB-dependent receptor [Lacihabitans lacunae]|uniref:TonB-dependent receptor n=1 Tax=Lacihabitans lacunae TaxID=1028214 RepID=A0ABV7YSF1_9BACT
MKTKIILLIVFSIFQNIAFAQKTNCGCFVKGIIKDNTSKEGIPGALILIPEQNKAIFSDENGNYKITGLCEGKFKMKVTILGYSEQIIDIDLTHETEHDFSLNENQLHLKEVNVTAKKIESIGDKKEELSDKAIFSKSGESLASSLSQINGLTMLQNGATISKPVIHGLHSNRILILNNGVRHEGQQWGNEHAPEIDPFMAKKVSVIKGAKGVRYGSDAIGGVIMVESNPLAPKDSISTEINQTIMTNGRNVALSAIVEGGLGNKIGWRAQMTGKKAGNLSTPNYNLANTGFQEFNFSLEMAVILNRIEHKILFSQVNSKIGIFSGSHIGNTTDLKKAIEAERPLSIYTPEAFTYEIGRPYQDIQHNLTSYKGKLRLKNNSSLEAKLGYQYNFRSEVDVLRGDRNTSQVFKIHSETYELLYNHLPIFDRITGYVGSNGLVQQNIATGTILNPIRSKVLIPNFSNFTNGVFLVERLLNSWGDFEFGVRIDYRKLSVYRLLSPNEIKNNVKENFNFSGSLGFEKTLSKSTKITYNIATAWKPPTVNELYSDGVHHGAASYEVGDENLTIEKALNNSLGLAFNHKMIDVDLQFYLNRINNYIYAAPTGLSVLSVRGAFPEFRYTQTNALFSGVDYSQSLHFNRFITLNSQVSLLRANDLVFKQPLIFIPANRTTNAMLIANKKLFFDEIKFEWQYVARQNRTPDKSVFSLEGQTSDITLIGGDYAPTPLAYHTFNISSQKTFLFKKGKSLNLGLECKNVLNTAYRDYLNRFRYYADEIGRNVILRTQFFF